jgi:hypothetical protein
MSYQHVLSPAIFIILAPLSLTSAQITSRQCILLHKHFASIESDIQDFSILVSPCKAKSPTLGSVLENSLRQSGPSIDDLNPTLVADSISAVNTTFPTAANWSDKTVAYVIKCSTLIRQKPS